MCTPMHQILPTRYPNSTSPVIHSVSHLSPSQAGILFLGSMSATMDRDLLKSHRITHVVQVLDAPWAPISEKEGFRCLRIDIHDKPSADLKPHLERACQYIASALTSGGNVLVHCQQVRHPRHLMVSHDWLIPGVRVSPDHLPSSLLTSSIISECRMTRRMRSSSAIDLASTRTPDSWQHSVHGKVNGVL